MPQSPLLKTIGFTLLALIAFAGNSILCRWALADHAMDPVNFSLVRLLTGAITLWLLVRWQQGKSRAEQPYLARRKLPWWGALWLLLYAYAFAFAYIELATGVGALILFTAVQLSMLLIAAWRGERFAVIELGGIALALAGFTYLVWPQFADPLSAVAVAMMLLAGSAWGAYSTVGRGSSTPLLDTQIHFQRALLLAVPSLFWGDWTASGGIYGWLLAGVSGSLTSAVGYALWFRALPLLRVSTAAVAQLSVPLIAALGGLLFVNEPITSRFILASAIILFAISLVIRSRNKQK
ncbi:hypothetical protein IDAT_02615 [Pseudidiomarina atlantica]|uniref:EamA domain-containing protein n=1 Tax=Pseudidiomarina atlantica TaxID=1517416 RepID=A0A094L5K8_9GAMM|nr:DMT family transporter [Pseudidiomarina atlantica]KFZ29993.1 hypothetical protein IDAT_02615 [Pseudidiomarina atlantica]